MNRILKLTILFILSFMIISKINFVKAETYNLNDNIDLGRYNIYYREGASYIRYYGIGQVNYMYFYRRLKELKQVKRAGT